MCTAVTYRTKDLYFGRTLDHTRSYGEEVVIVPRNMPLAFRHGGVCRTHYAIIGMAHTVDGSPLFYDAVNEYGLCMAGLHFVGNAVYGRPSPERDNVAHFELIPWVLCQCRTVKEAKDLLLRIQLTDTAFSPDYPPSQLHWLLADRQESAAVEPLETGLELYPDPVGVLTNNPPFPYQLTRLGDYLSLTSAMPENRFSGQLELKPISYGMGAMGLPGDLSSQSRFVRAAFVRFQSVSAETEQESVNQLFHILGAVEQPRGCTRTENGTWEYTLYTSCCNADKGIYYYKTYENTQITAVSLRKEDLDGTGLIRYPLRWKPQFETAN